MLSEQLFEKCEEFFDLISDDHRTSEVVSIIDNLSQYLTDMIDGRMNRDNFVVAEEVESEIQNIWSLLPASERRSNNNLRDYFDDILETTSRVLDCSPYDFDDEDDCDEKEFEDDESDFDNEEE